MNQAAIGVRATFRLTAADQAHFATCAAHLRDHGPGFYSDRATVFRAILADAAERIRRGDAEALTGAQA